MTTHPARTMSFDDLWAGLQDAKAKRLVSEVYSSDGLSLFCYTQKCVYERAWDLFMTVARGLILDPASKSVVATPFPKFFNVGERSDPLPDLPFDATEKLDGSLIILFHYAGRWRCATKGSFDSVQARWAMARVGARDLLRLDVGTTYLCEAVYPANRIVVRHPFEGLSLLGGYRSDGRELTADEVWREAAYIDGLYAGRHEFSSVSDMLARAKTLPAMSEGWVVRFSNGLRLKIKGDEYCRLHRAVSRVTPLGVWEMMVAGDDLVKTRRELPEEFWDDFDQIVRLLNKAKRSLYSGIEACAVSVSELSDKEIGLLLASFPEDVRGFVFPFRKGHLRPADRGTRAWVAFYNAIRPTGNDLPGYVPSSAITQVVNDDS